MTGKTQATGKWGEEIAARYLENQGYTICARNIHTAHGEIDIVAGKEAATHLCRGENAQLACLCLSGRFRHAAETGFHALCRRKITSRPIRKALKAGSLT